MIKIHSHTYFIFDNFKFFKEDVTDEKAVKKF